jgi:drug/metabolite transporter (DMT)-like permease
MVLLELSAALAILAAVCSALQALAVEYGLDNGDVSTARSPALLAAFISIVVSVVVFWALLAVRGLPIERMSVGDIAPFAVAGLANPAAFRLLYFRSIDRIGARLSAAVVSANPAIAAVLALPLFREPFTVLTGVGLACIVVGAIVLQMTGNNVEEDGDLLLEELAGTEPRDIVVPGVAMLMLGASFVLVKVGLNRLSDPLMGTAIGQTTALVAFGVLFGVSGDSRRNIRIRDRTALVAFTLAGVFVAGNWLAWFSALQVGTVVNVVPLSNTYPLFIVAFSYLAARQVPKSPRVIGGIVAIVVGAMLMQVA